MISELGDEAVWAMDFQPCRKCGSPWICSAYQRLDCSIGQSQLEYDRNIIASIMLIARNFCFILL